MSMYSNVGVAAQEMCVSCPSTRTRKVTLDLTVRYRNVPVTVKQVEMYECDACGERFSSADQADAFSDRVKEAARNSIGLLPPDRIIEIRNQHGLSQKNLEFLLGIGEKVVSRWENGRVLQSKAADDLLRLMERLPSVVPVLNELRGEDPDPL